MNAIELAWEEEKKICDKEVLALGIERAMVLWFRGGEAALALHRQAADQIHAERIAFGEKMIRQMEVKKALKAKKPK